MSVRFTESNWKRFDTHNKETTTRFHSLKVGWQKAIGGSRFKPVTWGIVYVSEVMATKTVDMLTLEDAKADGFESLADYLMELGFLDKRKHCGRDIVYIHKVERG